MRHLGFPPGLPVELRLDGRHALVLGRDPVTAGKVARLEDCGARVRHRVVGFEEADLDGVDLVLLTDRDQPGLADRLAALCRARRILLWTHDRPATCDFTMAGLVEAGPLRVAVSTGGQDPLLASAVRRALAAALAGAFADWAARVAGRWRRESREDHRARFAGLRFEVQIPQKDLDLDD